MNADNPINFTGLSGKTYRYWLLRDPRIAAAIKDEGGNYVFVRQMPNGSLRPLYFGVADSLRSRLPCHECWSDAFLSGVTHVLAHTTPAGDAARREEERDLIQLWNPALNVHHRTLLG